MVFLTQNETESFRLWQSTDSRRRMKSFQQSAKGRFNRQSEVEVTTQMSQMTCANRSRPRLRKVGGELLQLSDDIGSNIPLLLDVFVTPPYILLVRHGTSQCYRLPLVATARQQYLWSCRQPHTALRSINQTDKHARIGGTSFPKQHVRCITWLTPNLNTTGQDKFLKIIIQ